MIDPGLTGRVALITGANQGIGAATAIALAAHGAAVLLTYKRLDPAEHAADPAFPPEYGELRARDAGHVLARIRENGGRAEAVEADLADPATVPMLFDRAEAAFGPVEILVNNASGWLADTFLPDTRDRFGRALRQVDAASLRPAVRGGRARPGPAHRRVRPPPHPPRRHLGPDHRAHLRRPLRIPPGGVVRRGQGGPGELHHVRRRGARPPRRHRERRPPAGHRHRMGHPRGRGGGARAHPDRKVATPEEVAEVIVFLASEQARRVTGQVITMS